MTNKICICKACRKEITKTAKTCPHCGAKNKKGHPIFITLLIFTILIIIISASSNSDVPVQIGDNSSVQTSSTNQNYFLPGGTAALSNVSVSLVNLIESKGSAYNLPAEGNVFILCEFEIENNSKNEITVSSVMSFEAYCDDYTCTYSLSALMEKGSKNQLDGTVAPGKKINGMIGYEVPADWKEFEIHFTPDFWNGKDIVFIASNA